VEGRSRTVTLTLEGVALAVIAVCMVVLTFHWT